MGLTVIYFRIADPLPGRGWRGGLAYAVLIWWSAFQLREIFFPINVLGEPLTLVAYELALGLGLCAAFAIPIAALAPRPA